MTTTPAPTRLAEDAAARRVRLHRWCIDEADQYGPLVLANIEHLRPWVSWVRFEPITHDQRVAQLIEFDTAWRRGDLAAVYGAHDGPTFVGVGTLNPLVDQTSVELGYWVDHRQLGHGYATDIAATLVDIAFAHPIVTSIEIHHDLANAASARVPHRLGFTRTGLFANPDPPYTATGVGVRWVLDKATWAALPT